MKERTENAGMARRNHEFEGTSRKRMHDSHDDDDDDGDDDILLYQILKQAAKITQ